jgi:hypothetical protein
MYTQIWWNVILKLTQKHVDTVREPVCNDKARKDKPYLADCARASDSLHDAVPSYATFTGSETPKS